MILSSRLAAPILLARRAFSLQPDPFAKFAEGIMRGNQKVFNRVAADIAGRGLPAGAATRRAMPGTASAHAGAPAWGGTAPDGAGSYGTGPLPPVDR